MRSIFSLFLVAALSSCTVLPALAVAEARPVRVMVSILPLKGLVAKIGGNSVEVAVMVRPGSSPETYEPTPEQMVYLQSTQVFFAAGVPFEKAWLSKIQKLVPNMKVVLLGSFDSDMDPHWWTDPNKVATAVTKMAGGLAELRPDNAIAYGRAETLLQQELKELDGELKKLFAGKVNGKFLVYHPSWGHLAKAYGLKQVAIESHGKEPGPRDIQNVIQWGRKTGVPAVFVQKQFPEKLAKVVAKSVKAEIVRLDPLAENYQENLLQASKAIGRALR